MAGVSGKRDRRSRGGLSEDTGDGSGPSRSSRGEAGERDTNAAAVSSTHWETHEVLAKMNDVDFERAVQRAVASHRKIFKNQEKNWALVRLRVNLAPSRAAAEKARQDVVTVSRQRHTQSKPISNRNITHDADRWHTIGRVKTSSVIIKKFSKTKDKKQSDAPGAKQLVVTRPLKKANNVPRYTSYQYAANLNAHITGDVKRRLLYADGDGEMRAVSDDDESGSDSEDEDEFEPAFKTSPLKGKAGLASPDRNAKDSGMTSAMRAAEARRKREEEEAKEEAGTEWDPFNDYLLFSLSKSLGETPRAIDHIAHVIDIKAVVCRARLVLLCGSGEGKSTDKDLMSGGGKGDGKGTATSQKETGSKELSHRQSNASEAGLGNDTQPSQGKGGTPPSDRTPEPDNPTPTTNKNIVSLGAVYDAAKEAAQNGSTAHLEWRQLAMTAAESVRQKQLECTGLLVDLTAETSPDKNSGKYVPHTIDDFADIVQIVPKQDPEFEEMDLDDGEGGSPDGNGEAKPAGPGPSNLGYPGGAEGMRNLTPKDDQNSMNAVKEAELKLLNVWNLTAWRFLVQTGDIKDLATNETKKNESDKKYFFEDQTVDVAVDSFRELFCMRCHKYDCSLHGTGQKLRNKVSDDQPKRVWPHIDEATRETLDEYAKPSPCCENCFVNIDNGPKEVQAFNPIEFQNEGRLLDDAQSSFDDLEAGPIEEMYPNFSVERNGGVKWTAFEESFYSKLRTLYDNGTEKGAEPCAIARALNGPTCASVYKRLKTDIRVEAFNAARLRRVIKTSKDAGVDDRNSAGEYNFSKGGWGGQKRKAVSQRKKASATIKRRMQNSKSADAYMMQYVPCECCAVDANGNPGPCCDPKGKCACIRDGNFCEKWCGCGGNCGNDFPGCNCKTACNSRACPCVAADRECDPDLCKRCAHTSELKTHARRDGWPFSDLCMPIPPPPAPPTEPTKSKPRPEEHCTNMKLLLRQRKHVQMGLSRVAGWGAFLRDGALKGEMIGEYTGELIDQQDADKRGKVYDTKYRLSFLFNLNDAFVLDGQARGNKLKFINHSEHPNCVPKVLMVRGDHRIGMFALNDIAPGEELFFDYRYDKDKAPEWVVVNDNGDGDSEDEKSNPANMKSVPKKPKKSKGRCSNCGKNETCQMRRGPNGTLNELCNGCGLYFAKHGRVPPI
tara:strand:+ start:3643 stop:7164 length:3522 start_codon:yes stop_codon:yes gene_type:complete